MPKGNDWFAVDKDGLAAVLARRGPEFAVMELVQNSWDAPGVKTVTVQLRPVEGRRGLAVLSVGDDSPDGFADMGLAYTLYAPTEKRGDPRKRGRWTLGEKLVLALCVDAEISSTKGTVEFGPDGRQHSRRKRAIGSSFIATIRFTKSDIEATARAVRRLIPPVGVTTTFNGEELVHRAPIHAFEASLPTEEADADGFLRRVQRRAMVRIYEPEEGETATLYEMGLPVVETGDRYHVDVQQRVPLNADRDNVPPSYLRQIRTLVVNEMIEQLERSDVSETWAREALSDPRVTDAAVVRAMDLAFGPKRVAYDPSAREANGRATAEGFVVVHGGGLTAGQWANAKRAGAIQPAGQVTPSPKVLASEDGVPPIPREQWTPAMVRLGDYAAALARELLGFDVAVEITRVQNGFRAWYGGRRLTFNLFRLGHAWFENATEEEVDQLVVHELGHEFSDDHLSHDYHDALCLLAARMRRVTVRLDADPDDVRDRGVQAFHEAEGRELDRLGLRVHPTRRGAR